MLRVAPIYDDDERICSWKCKPTELIKIISHALINALPCIAVLLDERAGLELEYPTMLFLRIPGRAQSIIAGWYLD